jgi:RHS repeat-associated protein
MGPVYSSPSGVTTEPGEVHDAFGVPTSLPRLAGLPLTPGLAPGGLATLAVTAQATFGYRGELQIDGQLDLRARTYDPLTGRFNQPDPLPGIPGQALAANPYPYASNDPLDQIDPAGAHPIDDAVFRLNITVPNNIQNLDVPDTIGFILDAAALKTQKPVQASGGGLVWSPSLRRGAEAEVDTFAGILGFQPYHDNSILDVPSTFGGFIPAIFAEVMTEGGSGWTDDPEEWADDTTPGNPEQGDPTADTGCGNSFAATTDVTLADGSHLPIASVKVGDKVLATNLDTGKTEPKTVTAVLVDQDSDLLDLTVIANDHETVVQTTQHHLFYDPTQHRWVEAEALSPGEHLTTPDGSEVTVVSSFTVASTGAMWDLTVDGDHDFYVDISGGAVLVHNNSCPVSGSGVPPQLIRGQQFEQNGLQELGLPKNGAAGGQVSFGGSIPDSIDPTTGAIWEFKDYNYLTNSKQLTNFIGSGKAVNLVVGPQTRVSEPLQKAILGTGGEILVREGPGIYESYG